MTLLIMTSLIMPLLIMTLPIMTLLTMTLLIMTFVMWFENIFSVLKRHQLTSKSAPEIGCGKEPLDVYEICQE
jgi:hypothetical protein